MQGRYNVVGAHPVMEIVAKEHKVTIMDHLTGTLVEELVQDPMDVPRTISDQWKPQLIDDLPDAFCGNFFNFFCKMGMLERVRLASVHI